MVRLPAKTEKSVQIAPWKQSLVTQVETKVRNVARRRLHDAAIALRTDYGMGYDDALELIIETAEGMKGEGE